MKKAEANLRPGGAKRKTHEQREKSPDTENPEMTAESAEVADTTTATDGATTAAEGEDVAAGLCPNRRAEPKIFVFDVGIRELQTPHLQERLELFKTASKDLVVELLPVLDDFERGLQVMETATDVGSVKGVDLVYTKFRGTSRQRAQPDRSQWYNVRP